LPANWTSQKSTRTPHNPHQIQKRQFCIIPADNIFEPCYETGKPVRWRISHAKERPIGIGGIWEWKADGPDGLPLLSFSMLTINADRHPLMQRFHKPGEEKRIVVILEPQQYHDWLQGSLQDDAEVFAPYPADQLVAVADPLPPRSRIKTSASTA
jgi:putative SOS response-associated peptidase YedK